MNKSPSSIVADFLSEIVAAAGDDSPLKGAIVLDSTYQEIPMNQDEVKGFIVSNSEFSFAPKTSEMGVFDSLIVIAGYYRISGLDTTNRAENRDKNFKMMEAAVQEMYADQYLGGRVCNVAILRATDGDKSMNSDSFAVVNQPIILNPSGERIDYTLGEAQ